MTRGEYFDWILETGLRDDLSDEEFELFRNSFLREGLFEEPIEAGDPTVRLSCLRDKEDAMEYCGFRWKDSPEGYYFWESLFHSLNGNHYYEVQP